MRKNKGIAIPLSYIALAIVILVIGSVVAYFYLSHLKLTTQVETSELAKQETRLLEKLSLILWYKSGNKGIAIISNDGEIPVYIKKIYADGIIKDISSNPIIINPHDKIEAETPYNNGQSLMVETSSGNLIKFVEGGFTITGTTWVGSLPTEITTTSYIPTTITTTQTSISPTTITTTYLTTQTSTSYIPTTYTTTFTTTTSTTITTTTPTTITQTLSTTQTLTSYIPTTYTTTYATTGTATITTTIPTTITTTKSTTQTITSYIPTTYTSIITTTRTAVISPTTITSSYLITANLPFNQLFFKAQTGTVNGLNTFKLEPSSPSGYIVFGTTGGSDKDITYFGIRVWKRSSGGVETEITNGYPVAVVSVNYTVNPTDTAYGASWSCPSFSLSPTDSIVVRVYYKKLLQNIDWTLVEIPSLGYYATFTTDQLGINRFPASEWVVIYMLKRYSGAGCYWAFIAGAWGTYSRINFYPPQRTITQTITTTTVSYTTILYSMIENPSFLMTLCIIAVSITIEIRGRVKNGKYEK